MNNNNMFNDDITMSIASAVQDVLDGKAPILTEEVKYPHDMFHPKTGEKEVANNEKEHNALDAKGYTHEKNEVAEPQKPSGKLGQDSGEKAFADKHKGKKVGEKEDGTVVKEETISEAYNKSKELRRMKTIEKLADKIIDEIKDIPEELSDNPDMPDFAEAHDEMQAGWSGLNQGIRDFGSNLNDLKENSVNEATISVSEKLKKSGKDTLDVDYIGDDDLTKKLEKKFKVKIKSTGNTTADITGDVKNIVNLLKSDAYLMDDDEIEDTFPSLAEAVEPEEDETKLKESEKQEAYKKFFDAALKKFGVDSPADLDVAKKKEFFNYIDKNYKAKAEEIDAAGKSDDEEEVQEAMSAKDLEKRLKLIKKSVEKINKNNIERAKKDALKMMKDSGMFDEDASDEEEVDELTDKQKKLPAGLQKAIKAKEVNEGTLKVSDWSGDDAGGDHPKKFGLRVKKVGSGSYGGDNVEISGSDAKLVKWAQNNLGVEGKNLKAVQKELDEGTITEAQIRTSFESDEMKNVGGDKAAKKMGIRISFKKGKGDGMMGSDAGIFTGDEKNLVKYFQDFMGFEGKTFKELQKEYS